ncbi:MAG: 2OG-Fe(II) oxygenase [Pseudomonadota bacterium]
MMSYLPSSNGNNAVFDFDAVKDKGLELTEAYAAGDPFPHVVIDDFLPQPMIDLCLRHFPHEADPDSRTFDRDQERFKTSFHPDYLPPDVRLLFYAFNSRPFIRVIENITGIKRLIPDPHFLGGGFHEIKTGGHLSIHADFNHHKLMDLERRVNMLIYLNDDWEPTHGGQLELWRTDMSEKVQSIVPIANRCAIFTTTQNSMHGNPTPVAHPDGRSRKSIALYYYTATWDESRAGKTTQFYARPDSGDRTDWRVKSKELIEAITPPIVLRGAHKIGRLLRG